MHDPGGVRRSERVRDLPSTPTAVGQGKGPVRRSSRDSVVPSRSSMTM